MKAQFRYAFRGLDHPARLITLCCVVCIATAVAAAIASALLLMGPMRSQSTARLNSTSTIAYQLVVQDKDRFQADAELIAARTLVSEALSSTVTTNLQNEVLEPTRQTMGLDFILVLGSDLKSIGDARRIEPALISDSTLIRSVSTNRRPASSIVDTSSPDRTWIVAAAPVTHDDRVAGVVVVGRALDDSYVNALSSRLAGYQVVIARNSSVIAASSSFVSLLSSQHIARPPAVRSVGQDNGVQNWLFGTQRLDASMHTLGFGSQASIALLQPHDSDFPFAASTRLRAALLIAALSIVASGLVFLVVSWCLKPLRKLERQIDLATAPLGAPAPMCVPKNSGQLGISVGRLLGASARLHSELADERTRFRDVLHSMPVGIVISDTAGAVTFTNYAARDLLGLTLDNSTPFATPKDGIHTLEGNNGRVFAALSSRVEARTDGPASLVTVLQDVTREQQLEHMRADFLSTISHELRTPLTAVKSSVDLLLDGDAGAMTAVQQRFLQTIRRNS
jgi:signal transduction histidine kinase